MKGLAIKLPALAEVTRKEEMEKILKSEEYLVLAIPKWLMNEDLVWSICGKFSLPEGVIEVL